MANKRLSIANKIAYKNFLDHLRDIVEEESLSDKEN
jgi:hypothetical protein